MREPDHRGDRASAVDDHACGSHSLHRAGHGWRIGNPSGIAAAGWALCHVLSPAVRVCAGPAANSLGGMTLEHQRNRTRGAAGAAKRRPQKARTHPDLAEARALHKKGRLSEAEAIYAAILTREPDQAHALHGLGLIRVGQARKTEAHQLLTAAVASYDKRLDQGGDQAKILADRGNILYALERYFEALVSYDRALALKPDWAQVYGMRGRALYCLNRYRAALASLDKAIALRPDLIENQVYRARMLHKLNRYEEA